MINRKINIGKGLQKINEASCSLSSSFGNKDKMSPQRTNPLFIIPTPPSRPVEPSTLDLRADKLTSLQESIMQKKRRLNEWQQSQHNRQHRPSNLSELFIIAVQTIAFMGRTNSEVKRSVLQLIKQRKKKGVIEWVLSWIRELFWLVNLALTQRHISRR